MINKEKLKRLLIRPAQLEYFLRTIEDPEWFDFVRDEIGAFSHIIEPSLTKDGQYITFERWWPGQYLIKVANQIPQKVADVLSTIKTDNRLVIDNAMKAFLNMPVSTSKTLIPSIDEWFKAKYRGLIDHYSVELFQKFLSEKEYDAAVQLFDVLATVVPDERDGERFRYETFYFKELKGKHLLGLIEVRAADVLTIGSKWLKTAIKLSKGNSKTDFSTVWRPAIEPHEQNWDHDDVKDILTDVSRDALEWLARNQREESIAIVSKYFGEEYSIFGRLAVHALRVTNVNDALAKDVIKDSRYLFDHDLRHEFILLAREKIGLLTTEEKDKFFDSILRLVTPVEETRESPEKLSRYESFKLLSALKSHLGGRDQLLLLLSTFEKRFGEEKHPDIDSPHFSWTGPESPKNKDELSRWTPEQFLRYVAEEFKPEKVDWDPSPEGLSRIFEEVVQNNPEPYARIAPRFFDPKRIYPAYPTGLIRGLERACKEKKKFPLDPVLELSELIVKTVDSEFDRNLKTRRDEFSFGTFSWVRGAIGIFFDDLLRIEEFEIQPQQMERIKKILFGLIRTDPDPTQENEEKYGGNNMDFVTYCLNCNRGKAMRAIMQYALRWARTMRPLEEREAEKGKGPFPPGSRLEPDVKMFLNSRLKDETSPSVQSAFGFFLVYLYYLDKNWVREKQSEGLLFPKSPEKKQFWRAHWQGFIGFSRFYEEVFRFLREDFRLAIDKLAEKDQQSGESRPQQELRLAEHLMIAYAYGFEPYESNSLAEVFFEKASELTRRHAIGFLDDILKNAQEKDRAAVWKLLRDLWVKRKDIHDSEVAGFTSWLKYVPEKLSQLQDLIKPTIPYLHLGYQEEQLLDYINQNVEVEPLASMWLLTELFKIKQSLVNIHFRRDLIRQIMEKARRYSQDSRVADFINEAVNRLGEMGYYEYRDLLVTAQ